MLKNAWLILFVVLGLMTACSSTRDMNGVPVQKSVYEGNWTITDIKANVPQGIKISNLFERDACHWQKFCIFVNQWL